MDVTSTLKQRARLSLGLAPMEGVTDFATRLWITLNGKPDFTMTPFLRVTKDYPSKRISANFLPEVHLTKEQGIVTCIPQLMGSDEDDIIRIARHFLDAVPFVDINCGCPSPTVVGHGAGSQLLQDPGRFSSYLIKIVDALGAQRVSVKMRVGFDQDTEFPRLLETLRDLPLARLTVHGRTRADRYTGHSRWSLIDAAARQLSFPVVGSGDIKDALTLERCLHEAPHVSGVIIGRGALRDPWIFARLRENELRVTRATFRQSFLLFVLLQEAQAHFWENLFSAVSAGVFSENGTTERMNSSDERLEQIMTEILRRIPQISSQTGGVPHQWIISRGSLARGKMLWNYLRSSFAIPSEFGVALLRATTWDVFLNALDRLIRELPQDDVELRYRSDWDWVYSGAGSSKPQNISGQESLAHE